MCVQYRTLCTGFNYKVLLLTDIASEVKMCKVANLGLNMHLERIHAQNKYLF